MIRSSRPFIIPSTFIQFLRCSSGLKSIPEEYEEFTYGRGRRDRVDSLTHQILEDRRAHKEKLTESPSHPHIAIILEKHGFGKKGRILGTYATYRGDESREILSRTGAGGKAVYVGSFGVENPIFDHLLPEIALLGHSNAGKSTLVNSLIGIMPQNGPAKVSDRAGWTDRICYYRVGKRPPILTLVDFPGYGFAVVDKEMKFEWKKMINFYLKHRDVNSRCCVLVDSTRGLCQEDHKILRFLQKTKRKWVIVLTKADLLTADDLAKTLMLIKGEADKLLPVARRGSELNLFHSNEVVWPVSSSTGAGINELWKAAEHWAKEDALPYAGETNVREHKLAHQLRRKDREFRFGNVGEYKLSAKERRQLK